MRKDDGVSRIVRRLDRQYLATRPDLLLGMVHALAQQGGVTLAVGLLVDGVLVHGLVSGVEPFADRLDEAVGEVLDRLLPPDGEDAGRPRWHLFRDHVEMMREQLSEGLAARAKYEDFDNATIDDFDEDDVWDLMTTMVGHSHVELVQATVFAGKAHDVSTMRVRADRIGAWWPLEAETGVTIDYVAEP